MWMSSSINILSQEQVKKKDKTEKVQKKTIKKKKKLSKDERLILK